MNWLHDRTLLLMGLILAIFLIPLVYSPLFYDYDLLKIVLIQVFAILLAAIWICSMAIRGQMRFVWLPVYGSFFVYLALGVLSLFGSLNPLEGLAELFQRLCLFLFAMMVVHAARDPFHRDLLVGSMVAAGGLVALIGLLQYRGLLGFSMPDYWIVSTIGNVSFVGEYYNIILPLSLVFVFCFESFWLRWLCRLPLLFIAGHIALLDNRGVWIGVGVTVLTFSAVWVIKHPQVMQVLRRWGVTVLLLLVIALTGDWMVSSWDRISRRFEATLTLHDDSSQQRIYLWQDTLRMIFGHPFSGVGVGQFEYHIPQYASQKSLIVKDRWERLRNMDLVVRQGHNEYLEICAEAGFLGLGAFGLLLFQIGKIKFGLLKNYLQNQGNLLSVGLAAAFVSTLLHALVNMNFQNPVSGFCFWLVLGIAWSLHAEHVPERVVALKRRSYAFGLMGGSVFILFFTLILNGQMLFGAYHYNLGALWLKKGRHARAEIELEQALGYWLPRRYIAQQALGMVLLNQGKWEAAGEAFRKSLRLHPYHGMTHYALSLALLKLGNLDDALWHARKAVALNDINPIFHAGLGQVLGVAGYPGAAQSELQRALELNPYRPESLYQIGVAFLELNDLENARKVLQDVVNRWPGNGEYHLSLSKALMDLGDVDNALAHCQEAIRLRPDLSQTYAVLGAIYNMKGNWQQAYVAYQKAFEQNPEDRSLKEMLDMMAWRFK